MPSLELHECGWVGGMEGGGGGEEGGGEEGSLIKT